MRKHVLAVALLATLVALAVGSDSQASSKPRCAVKNPEAPRILGSNPKGAKFIWGEFLNRCLDPVLEMGSYACLEEIDNPGGPAKPIECHANIDRPVLFAPHETNVFMVAKCDYTSIPRYYQVTGYGWALSLPTDGGRKYKSTTQTSSKFGLQMNGKGAVHFCHISPAGTSWRNFR